MKIPNNFTLLNDHGHVTQIKMTSFHSASSLSRREREFPYPRQNRRRKGCSSNKFFTKTGMFLLLGVIILTALPTKGSCRPVEEHVYGLSSSSSSSSSHHSLEKEGADDEEAIGSRFEFQRKIVSSSSSTSSDDNNSGSDDDDVHSLELISSNNNEGASNENSPLSNSSTIVHVIVTSSSSTSSSEVETDSEPEDETIQYTVEVRDDGEGESSDGGTMASSSSQLSSETLKKQDLSQEQKPSEEIHRPNEPDQLELKKLPKFEDDSSSRPVQDIFSAFYNAFTQNSSSPPPSTLHEELESSFAQSNDDSNSSVATFSLSQPYFRTRRLPQSFQSYQQRRRQFANRPKQLQRKSFSSPQALSEQQSFSLSASDKEMNDKQDNVGDVEETARKLEFLAKKLDKVEQQNKILEPSPSTVVETSSAAPFLTSSSSTFSTLLSPPNVAVSVAVTRSESVAGPRGKKGAASSSAIDQDDEKGPTRQRARVAVVVKKNAKNETTLGQEEEKLLSTAHTSTPRLPSRRPKPLIKSLPKYEEDNDDGRINNKNSGNKNNFPRNFSHGLDTGTGTGPFPEKGYNHNTRETDVNSRVGSNDDEKVKENNFRVLQDRQNIIAFSEDGDEGPNSSSSASVPSAESSSFVEITASRPTSMQRRKTTRTVSGEIGDPSTYPFNLPKNNFQLLNRKAPQPRTTTQRPKVVNWQQPEKVWGEPAQVWGLPAEVWGQPERVWSEPAKVWGNTEKSWQKSTQRKQLAEVDLGEMMQSDQPPEDRGSPGEEASTKENEDDMSPQGTFVILGDDETEGDSIDGDLGRPLMLHHFTIPPKPKETVSISTSVSSSVSSNSKKGEENEDKIDDGPLPFPRQVGYFQQPSHSSSPIINAQFTRVNSKNTNSSSFNVNINNSESSSNNSSDPSGKKAGKKFGYVIEGANVRKYRVEERTPDGYIVGEYGVLNNQNAFLRGVRYTADGTINPRLIHEALMKFLSLRR